MTLDGLEAIFMTNRPALSRFLSLRSGGTDVDDLLQELWLKVRALESGPIAEPRAYLFKMAENLVHDRRRGETRRSRREDAWGDASPDAVDIPSTEQALIAREQLRIVDQAIDALGERTAAIFRSYRIDGIGQRDIAQMTGISVSAVEKHLQKAYRTLIDVKRVLSAEIPVERRREAEGSIDAAQ